MHNIIITADDFGIGKQANEKIIELAELGKLQRVGIMIHGTIDPDQLGRLIKTGVSLDIHLDILHEFSDKRHQRVGKLFSRLLDFFVRLLRGKLGSNAAYVDWKNQIDLFEQLIGKRPDGINSHEHIHFFPPLFRVALRLRDEYHIDFIRLGERSYPGIHGPVSLILDAMRLCNAGSFKKSKARSTDHVVSIDWISNIKQFSGAPASGTTEIVCHPELKADFDAVMKLTESPLIA